MTASAPITIIIIAPATSTPTAMTSTTPATRISAPAPGLAAATIRASRRARWGDGARFWG